MSTQSEISVPIDSVLAALSRRIGAMQVDLAVSEARLQQVEQQLASSEDEKRHLMELLNQKSELSVHDVGVNEG